MTTKSKVAYLSKYTTLSSAAADRDGDNDNDAKRRRHPKKKSKQASRHRPEPKGTQKPNGLIDIDNDNMDVIASVFHIKSNGEIDDDLEDDEEDAPVVVDPDTLQHSNIALPHVPRGQWKSEETSIVRPVVVEVKPEPNGSGKDDPDQRRRRHDSSSSEQEEEEENSSPHDVKRSDPHHHHETAHPRRPRHDSESDDMTSSQRRRERHDSASNDDDEHDSTHRPPPQPQQQQRRKRHDSSDSSSSKSRRVAGSRGDPSNQAPLHRNRERMSSGHAAGIQTTFDFTRREQKLQQRKRDETNEFVGQHGSGGGAETIYRDRESGQKLNDPQQQQQQRRNHRNQVVLSSEEQRILNTGRVQLEQEAQMKLEFQKIQESQFARHRDDSELDRILKSKIHADDPMAAYAAMKQKPAHIAGGGNSDAATAAANTMTQPRPRYYKGPPPKPNRYQIPPGYRWDARDRGNGFEDLLLAKQYQTNHEKEQAYRYSSADM